MNTEEIQDKLSAPFMVNEINYRVGSTNKDKTSGMCLYYMDSRAVESRLDDVLGIDGWQARYPYKGCCDIGIKLNGEWLWKSNGAGETDFEAEKGQYSDAFKRAATMWGIGRYLYGGGASWYDIQARGRSYAFTNNAMVKIKQDYAKWLKALQGEFRFKPGERDEVVKQVKDALFNGDEVGLKQILSEYNEPAEKMKVWSLFTSWESDSIKKLTNDGDK